VPSLRERIRNREPVIGSFVIELPVRATVEAYAAAGFDFLVLDLEHSATDFERLSFLVTCCHAEGIGSVVRIEAGHESQLTRVLDMHPNGVMVPSVSSADEVKSVVRLSRFHPLGERGLAPMVRHHLEAKNALASIDEQTVLIVQVEGRVAADNAAAIAAVDGVDCVFVGPYDLSQSLGIPGELQDPKLLEAGSKMAHDVIPHAALGVYVSEAAAAEAWRAVGATFFTHATDGQLFLRSVHRARKAWRSEDTA
jgi:4-hydroxy-2-oxoheptanedioate aldolase